MRTESATLTAAQKTGGTPYVPVQYYNGADWVSVSDDVRRISVNYGHYQSTATLTVDNSQETYKTFAEKGSEVKIGFGYVTSGGNESSELPHFWVDGWDWVGKTGVSDIKIYLIGVWEKLSRWRSPSESIANLPGSVTDTVKDLISSICTSAGVTLGTSISEDSVVDTLMPFMFTRAKGEDGLSIIIRLLRMTSCELIPQGDEIKLIHPQAGDSSVYTYSASTHQLNADTRGEIAFFPNKVTVSGMDGTTATSGSYTATEAADVGTWEYAFELPFEDNQYSNAECATMAQAMVERFERASKRGRIDVPINCYQEIWDVITVNDPWTGKSITNARVGYLNFIYEPAKEIYRLLVGIGSYQELPPDATPADILRSALAYPTLPLISGSAVIPHSINPDILRQSMQPFTVDLDILAKDDDEIYWHGSAGAGNNGAITFKDQGILSLNHKPVASAQVLTGTHYLYFEEGDNDVKITSTLSDTQAKNRGLLAVVQKCAAGDGKALIRPSLGKVPLFNASVIAVDYLSALSANMGTLTAGTAIFIDSGTNWNSWADPDTATGLVIGYDSGSDKGKLAAYNAGTVQVYIDTDGKLKAGAGSVIIENDGIRIIGTGKLLSFEKTDGGDTNYLYCDSGSNLAFEGFDFLPTAGGQDCGSSTYYWEETHTEKLFMVGTTGVVINASGNKQGDIGTPGTAFDDICGDDFQNEADFYHLDSYDDVAAIEAIKGSGHKDPRTGFEMIDDDTLPEWLLTRTKDGKHIVRSDDGKPYLALKTVDSLLMGAIRQMNARLKTLEARL